MSALNICIKPDRCIILQDAASYYSDGVVAELSSKGQVVADNGLFVASTGSIGGGPCFAMFAEDFADIDDLALSGEDRVADWYEHHLPWLERNGGIGVTVAFVGWSHTFGAPRFVLFSRGVGGSVWATDQAGMIHPSLKGAVREEWVRHHGAYMDTGRFDGSRDGVRLMELQRLQPSDVAGRADRPGQFVIGGHIKQTEVFRDRIAQRILLEWPEDVVGERIRPTPRLDTHAHPNVVSMNRAERRRQEKLARRGAA